MQPMLGSILTSRNSLKITQDEFGQANILGILFKYQEVTELK